MSKLTPCLVAAALAGCGGTGGWRALRVDASSQQSFEESVATLQQELPYYRNQRFTQALAAIWMTDVSDAGGDLDRDGDVDEDDAGMMLDFVVALSDGAPTLPIDDGEEGEGGYKAADYYRQFDGLGYDEVVGLADPRILQEYSRYLARQGQEQAQRFEGRLGPTRSVFGPPNSPAQGSVDSNGNITWPSQ